MPEASGSLRESSLTEEEVLAGNDSGTDDEHDDGTIPGNESNRAPRVQFDARTRGSLTEAAAGASRKPPDAVAPSILDNDNDSHNPKVKAKKVVQGRWIRKVKGVRVAPAPHGAKVPVVQGHKSTPATGLSIYQIQRMKRHFGEEGTLHTEARKHIIERWTHTHLVLKLAIIAVLAVVLLFLGAYAEPLVSGRLVWVSGALLLFSTLIGIRGAMVVVRDIQRDDDGLETPGQRMLQVYFHIALAFVVLFLPFAIGLLRDPIGYEGDVLATLFEAGDALLWEEAKRLLFAAGFIGLIVALVILTSLQSVVKIVTFYEITQSFLETFSLTLIAFGILLIYLLLSLFKEAQFLSSNEAETLVGIMDSRIILATICTVFVVGMSIIGFFAAWFESRRLLLFHAVGMAFLGVMIFTFGILILSLDWPAYIEGRCYQVVKTMSADWWTSALQCTKYGGTSIGALVEAFDDTTSTWVYLINGVGSAARCADSSQYAQAWEYAPITMANRTVDLVGCVNLACCSTLSSILSSMTFTIAFAFTLLLVGIFVVVFGDLWLRRETNKDTNNIKYFSRTRAFWILTMSTFLTLLAIIILTVLLKGDLGRATEDLVLAEDIQQFVNKTSLLVPTGDEISPHSCSNQVRDGAETDIDCGGIEGQGGCSSEQRCRARQKCLEDSDCLTDLICDSTYQVCVLPPSNVTCSNGKRDVLETDVDCGGPSCPGCGNGQTCSSNADCYFLHCESGVCISCSDGIKNGDEADVDCGAQHCVQEASLDAWAEDAGQPTSSETFDNSQYRGPNGLCLSGARCSKGAQCEGGLCIEGSCASCSNGLLDGDETDVDCGGSYCQARCSAGAICSADSDCVSGTLCDAATSTCVWEANLTCAQDGVQNNDETDVDCGGEHNSCERCGESMQCSQNNDCASGICHVVNGTGYCASCSNGIQDGDEAGVDCGGSMCASRCSVDDPCTSTSDCATGLFCWNEVNVDAAVQHYMQTHEVDSEATARAELATVFPSTGSCQVPFTLTIKALSPVFYMNTQVNYGDLFESEALSGLQLDGSSDTDADISSSSTGGTRRRLMREREPRRRLRELASAVDDGYVNSLTTEEENTWPYLCNLTVQSALASTGTHFQIEDDGGATVTTWNTSSQSGVDILIQHGDAFPLIYIVPTTCTDLRESEITTTWSVDSSCDSVNVEKELEIGVASLLVPLTTSLAGYVRSSKCTEDPSHVDCILITGVTVTLRSYRAGLCANVMPAPLASCGSCVSFHYHQCVSDHEQACCYWEDSEEDNAAAISACLNDAEEFVQTETYTNQIPGLYFLSWPELYTDLTIASSHTVLIQFSKEGYQDAEAIVTIPVGGMQFISDVYMNESGTDEYKTTPSPTPHGCPCSNTNGDTDHLADPFGDEITNLIAKLLSNVITNLDADSIADPIALRYADIVAKRDANSVAECTRDVFANHIANISADLIADCHANVANTITNLIAY
ncbi:Hypothetical Protein FCC1311_053862 [Hondaea fermentalgiana]|uniref:Uncharacterized protein n=1 Tax=Hondaea fermentalgiana TaxID=2315210 RepID=A0A2R5GMS2_9STRA|nr:Hypothetical Protein FCC1311_053862 [Hondaea fermentalgiana]|eukprot:GBG29164.1 Hypothetical Protein FCC1311_053862 [Hondaea fermentalgiana]